MMHQELTAQKPVLFRIFLVCFIVVEFNILMHVPVPGILVLSDSILLLILLSFYAYYVLMSLKYRQISVLLVVLSVMLLVPFVAGIQAQRVFQQPFIYGFLSERTKFLIISPLLLVYLLDAGYLNLLTLERVLIRVAFFYFFTALLLYVFIDPVLFESTNFVIISPNKGGRYNINQALVLILLFYSLYKTWDQLKIYYLILAVTILVYLVLFVKGRSLLFAVFVTIGYLVVVRLPWRQKVFFLSFSVLGLFVLGGVGLAFFSNELNSLFSLFGSAYSALTGGEAQDGSAASRIIQVDIALEGFRQNPILGNGFLSSQWQNGFQGQFRHFYPSDIGWLGLIYIHGLLGFVLLNLPFYLSWKYSRKLRKIKKGVFLKAIESFMLYLFIHSIFAGFAIKKIGMIVFPFAIIYFYYFLYSTGRYKQESH